MSEETTKYFTPEELYHYGVLGMKWGVHKAVRKSRANERLARKALDYDRKAAKIDKKAEKIHADQDLGMANKAAKKSAKYAMKSAKIEKKALKTDDEAKQDRLRAKAANLNYQAATAKKQADRISKLTGYGEKAMKLSVKSDEFVIKAANARRKIANNELYINAMNRKIDSFPEEYRATARAALNG